MKMKELGLLFMMLCMVFAVNAQELMHGHTRLTTARISSAANTAREQKPVIKN